MLPKVDLECPKVISPLVALLDSLYYHETGPMREKLVEFMVNMGVFAEDSPNRDSMIKPALEKAEYGADVLKVLGRREAERKGGKGRGMNVAWVARAKDN